MTRVTVYPEVFNDIFLPYLTNFARTQIFYGGASSGKSVFLAQRCIFNVMQSGRNYLICRKVGATIRRSVFNEIEKVIADWGVRALFDTNKSEMTITCANGYQILFAGLDDPEKIKSITPIKGVITDIWVEEATETEDADIVQLTKRQRGGDPNIHKTITLSFNPILQTHWIFNKYFSRVGWADDQTEYHDEKLSILKTWYIHNRFLTPDDIYDLVNEKDKYYRDVYTFGNWGVLGHVIFTNWRSEDLSGKLDQFTNRRTGLDFGFSSDPAALNRCHYDRAKKEIYIFDELHELGLTNPQLAALILPMCGQDVVKCDSAEPKSIRELRDHGVNAYPAKKGPDSVNFGIQWLQQQTIIIDKKCIFTQNEFRQYHWKEDKNGNAIRQPVDRDNHHIDEIRYGFEDDMIVRKAASSRQG